MKLVYMHIYLLQAQSAARNCDSPCHLKSTSTASVDSVLKSSSLDGQSPSADELPPYAEIMVPEPTSSVNSVQSESFVSHSLQSERLPGNLGNVSMPYIQLWNCEICLHVALSDHVQSNLAGFKLVFAFFAPAIFELYAVLYSGTSPYDPLRIQSTFPAVPKLHLSMFGSLRNKNTSQLRPLYNSTVGGLHFEVPLYMYIKTTL